MILDDSRRIAFVHIPKCGGTSVKSQLKAFDSYGGHFQQKGEHPNLGLIHFSHIPLFYLEREFPQEFGKIVRYRSFALCRDPHTRFASATFQRLEEFGKIPPLQITSDVALTEAKNVIAWLSKRERFCDLEYIHFSRQLDYVELNSHRIVKEIYQLEEIRELGLELGRCFGIDFDPEKRENVNFASLNSVFTRLRTLKPVYSRLTSWRSRERILHLMQRWRLRSPTSLYERFREDPKIATFVEAYYAADFALRRDLAARSVIDAGSTGRGPKRMRPRA